MPTQINGVTLVNGQEMAQMLRTKLKNVINYNHAARKRGYPDGEGKFPKPYLTIEGHPLWLQTDAQAYATNRPSALRKQAQGRDDVIGAVAAE
jgi:hypothetical protein